MQSNTKHEYVPPLFFSRKWHKELSKNKIKFSGISWVDRENVVMHISMKQLTDRSFVRVATGAHTKHNRLASRRNILKTLSGADLDSPFSHLRFNTQRDGKILKFEKNQNLIRGKAH